jgi:hypothetical protein
VAHGEPRDVGLGHVDGRVVQAQRRADLAVHERGVGAAGATREQMTEHPYAEVRVAHASRRANARGGQRRVEVVRPEARVRVAPLAHGANEHALRQPRQPRGVRRQVGQRRRPAAGGPLVQRRPAVLRHPRQQQRREHLGDRPDLEDRVLGDRTARKDLPLVAGERPDDDAGTPADVPTGVPVEDARDALGRLACRDHVAIVPAVPSGPAKRGSVRS